MKHLTFYKPSFFYFIPSPPVYLNAPKSQPPSPSLHLFSVLLQLNLFVLKCRGNTSYSLSVQKYKIIFNIDNLIIIKYIINMNNLVCEYTYEYFKLQTLFMNLCFVISFCLYIPYFLHLFMGVIYFLY